MAIAVKAINGSVVIPSSVGWTGGKIRIKLNVPGTVLDGAIRVVINGYQKIAIGEDGVVSFNVVANDIISPSGTIYVAQYTAPDGFVFTQFWTIATSDADPLNIGNIAQVLAPDTSGAGTDSDAIHDDVDGEIAAITEKTSHVTADLILIEDSAASHAKKRMTIDNLIRGRVFTNAGKPAANVNTVGIPFRVRDPNTTERWEVVYQTSTDGVYAHWPFVTPM